MKILLIYLLTINAVAMLFMLADKCKAKKKAWRIPEATLMGLAAIGGSLGALMGMQLFRHKTKHPKFFIGIPVLLVLHIALLLWLIPKIA